MTYTQFQDAVRDEADAFTDANLTRAEKMAVVLMRRGATEISFDAIKESVGEGAGKAPQAMWATMPQDFEVEAVTVSPRPERIAP